MTFPSGADPTDWICAVYSASTKVLDSDAPFSSNSTARMRFYHYPSPTVGEWDEYQIKVGKIMYINEDPVIDPSTAVSVLIPENNNSKAKIQAYPYQTYAFYAAPIIVAGAESVTGWWENKPNAARMLRIFRDGNANDLSGGYAPNSITNKNFNCFSGEFSEWLTHNAGANFALNGSVFLKEYVWEKEKNFSKLAANAPQFLEKEIGYWVHSVLPDLLVSWQSKPNGYQELTQWYSIPVPYEVELTDPSGSNDLNATFGRIRAMDHQVQFYAKKTSASTITREGLNSKGEFIDLYDFNITTAFPADVAAMVQLGYGNGNKGVTLGQIFRSKIIWEKLSPP